jgi:hypothetical protein
MMTLSTRDRRALFAGLSVVGTLLLWTHGRPRYVTWLSELRERAWLAESQRQRLHHMLAAAPSTADALAAARGRYLALAPRVITGDGAGAAGSTLLALISGAMPSGVAMGSLEAEGDSTTGRHFLRVAVRGDFTTDVMGLSEFILAMEGGPARLGVRELAIDQPDPAAPTDRAEALRVRFIVEGVSLRPREAKDR